MGAQAGLNRVDQQQGAVCSGQLARRGIELGGDLTARIAFADAPLNSADGVRPAVVALARRARGLAEAAT